MTAKAPDPTRRDALQEAVDKRVSLYERQIITENELNNGVFGLFVNALCDDPEDTTRIVRAFESLSDSIWSHFEYLLRRLPCEGDCWDWPPGGALALPGGTVAWRTPLPEVQNAIATLRHCAIRFWTARGQTRHFAPGGPAEGCPPKAE